jgi:hypothetical protein
MDPRTEHAQEQIRAVVLDRTTEDLLISWDGRCALDISQDVDGCSNTEIADTGDGECWCCTFLRGGTFRTIFDRNFGKTNTNSSNVASEYVTSV